MYNLLLFLYHCCCYFFQFLAFTRISKFLLKLLCLTTITKAHKKKHGNNKFFKYIGIIIIIIIIIEKKSGQILCQVKKIRGKIMVGKKKFGEKFSHLHKIQSLFSDFFFPDKVNAFRWTLNKETFDQQWSCFIGHAKNFCASNIYEHVICDACDP